MPTAAKQRSLRKSWAHIATLPVEMGTSVAACNQGVGNDGAECDPGNSNQGDSDNSNDEPISDGSLGKPGNPGKKGGKK